MITLRYIRAPLEHRSINGNPADQRTSVRANNSPRANVYFFAILLLNRLYRKVSACLLFRRSQSDSPSLCVHSS